MKRTWIYVLILVVSIGWIPGKRYFEGGVCNIERDLSNKVIIVTGSSSGIGRETAKGLAYQNATIIMASRNQAKTEPIMEEIKKETGNPNIVFIPIDLSDLRSIKAFVQQFNKKYDRLDILVNNAGANSLDLNKQFTKDGFELNFGSNYFGHYYLTRLLMDTLQKTKESRVIFVSTKSATKKMLVWDDFNSDKSFDMWNALVQSKIASLIFADELQRRLEKDNVKVVSLHPGWVRTETLDNPPQASFGTKIILSTLGFFLKYFGKDSHQGAQTSLYCALEDFSKLQNGGYYSDCEEYKYSPTVDRSEENGKKLWDISERMIKEKLGDDAFVI